MLTLNQTKKVSNMVDKMIEMTSRKYPEFYSANWLEELMRKSDLKKYGKEVMELSIRLMRERVQ